VATVAIREDASPRRSRIGDCGGRDSRDHHSLRSLARARRSNVTRALRVWRDESAARPAGEIPGAENTSRGLVERFHADQPARCAVGVTEAQRNGRDRGRDFRVRREEVRRGPTYGAAGACKKLRKFPVQADRPDGSARPSRPAKRTQTKPIKASAKPRWPLENEKMRRRRRFAGDETNPLREARRAARRPTKGGGRCPFDFDAEIARSPRRPRDDRRARARRAGRGARLRWSSPALPAGGGPSPRDTGSPARASRPSRRSGCRPGPTGRCGCA
jgi:hypothetical protein